MAVTTAAAYGIYSQDVVLTDIVRNLNQAGFENEDICMMLAPTHPIASVVRDASLFKHVGDTFAPVRYRCGQLRFPRPEEIRLVFVETYN